jgi:hypothetical protein
LSLTVACPACNAPVNAVCTRKEFGSRVEVENYAAHWQRLNEARKRHAAAREACGGFQYGAGYTLDEHPPTFTVRTYSGTASLDDDAEHAAYVQWHRDRGRLTIEELWREAKTSWGDKSAPEWTITVGEAE